MEYDWMIVTRRRSPPHENRTELIYQGNPIEIKDIPQRLGFDSDARCYYYSILRLRKDNGHVVVLQEVMDLNDILEGHRIPGKGANCGQVSIPLESIAKLAEVYSNKC